MLGLTAHGELFDKRTIQTLVCIYARISTKKQDEANQLLQLREFVARQDGWVIVAEYLQPDQNGGRLCSG